MRDYSFTVAPGEEHQFHTLIEYTYQDPKHISQRYQRERMFSVGENEKQKPSPRLGLRSEHTYFDTKGRSSVGFYMEISDVNRERFYMREQGDVNGIKPTNVIEIHLDTKQPEDTSKQFESAVFQRPVDSPKRLRLGKLLQQAAASLP